MLGDTEALHAATVSLQQALGVLEGATSAAPGAILADLHARLAEVRSDPRSVYRLSIQYSVFVK